MIERFGVPEQEAPSKILGLKGLVKKNAHNGGDEEGKMRYMIGKSPFPDDVGILSPSSNFLLMPTTVLKRLFSPVCEITKPN